MDKWKNIQSFSNLEPRISINYKLNDSNSLKISYNKMVQYIHLLSNTAASSSLDVWTPSTNNIKPEKVDSYAIGYFKNFKENIFFLDFQTVRNTGKLRVSLTSNFIVKGNNKIVKNMIKSEQLWEKNVYLNCNVVKGASKITSIAFENLMNQAHEKIYSSVKNIVR